MSSTLKTLALLSHFSETRPEIGLSQMCRLAGRDKATTYRHLQSLETAGFLEQNPLTKHYRLGPAILQLAQVRETTVPRKAGTEAALATLSETTGETAHTSVLSGTELYSLSSCASATHATRAIIDIQTFPLHATATGLCALAFGPPELLDIAMTRLERFTPNTPATEADLSRMIDQSRETGFGYSDRGYEDDIQSLSAPLFDQTGLFAGAVAVACVASRFTPALERQIMQGLVKASQDITRNWGGVVPAKLQSAWTRRLAALT